MEIEAFVELADRQFKFLNDLAEIDSYFSEGSPERWQLRSTRADRRRYADFMAGFYDLPHIDKSFQQPPADHKWASDRVTTAKRVFDLETPFKNAAQNALAECDRHPELAELSPVILRFTATHTEWVGFGWTGIDYCLVTDDVWRAERSELWRLLMSRNLLRQDHKKQEWDRWKSLLSTQERREILDILWLAQRPLLRSEIDPTAGDGFRQKMMHIKEVAEKAKPRIPWTIESDSKRRWSKKWTGG